MIQSFGRLLRAEWRLYQHNKVNKLGVVDPNAQTFHVVPNVFADSMLQELLAELDQLKAPGFEVIMSGGEVLQLEDMN